MILGGLSSYSARYLLLYQHRPLPLLHESRLRVEVDDEQRSNGARLLSSLRFVPPSSFLLVVFSFDSRLGHGPGRFGAGNGGIRCIVLVFGFRKKYALHIIITGDHSK